MESLPCLGNVFTINIPVWVLSLWLLIWLLFLNGYGVVVGYQISYNDFLLFGFSILSSSLPLVGTLFE